MIDAGFLLAAGGGRLTDVAVQPGCLTFMRIALLWFDRLIGNGDPRGSVASGTGRDNRPMSCDFM